MLTDAHGCERYERIRPDAIITHVVAVTRWGQHVVEPNHNQVTRGSYERQLSRCTKNVPYDFSGRMLLTEIKYCIFSADLTLKLHTHKQSKLKRVEKKGSKGEQNDEDLTGREL